MLLALFNIISITLHAQTDNKASEKQRPNFLFEPQHPLRETRAVWLTTIGGLDWPRIKATDASSRERQKQELISILDNYKQANINTVILQTRVRAAVIYPSKIEPWELSLTGTAGKDPGYDPLKFCIDECHKRGMEVHSWIVCIPIGTVDRQAKYGSASLVKKHRNLVKASGQEMFMIPGNPETADYIASICKEVVENYDVDGISLDYIRYPEAVYKFSDENLYKSSCGLSKAEWKRENISRIVKRVHDVVKPIKPWVKLSSSPIGKYRDLSRYSAKGWSCYDAVWQDPQEWLKNDWQDLLFPMMYFKENHFYPFVFNWKEISHGHPVVPGLGIYFLDPREGRWVLNDVRQEMHTIRNLGIGGIAFYRGEFFTKNCKGIYDTTCDEFFPFPALTSRMTWMGDTLAPASPAYLKYADSKIEWGSVKKQNPRNADDYILYNVYGSNVWPVDVTKSENLLAVNVKEPSFEVKGRALKLRYFAVTAIDRLGNESAPVQESKAAMELPNHINVRQLINRVLPETKTKTKTTKTKTKTKTTK